MSDKIKRMEKCNTSITRSEQSRQREHKSTEMVVGHNDAQYSEQPLITLQQGSGWVIVPAPYQYLFELVQESFKL